VFYEYFGIGFVLEFSMLGGTMTSWTTQTYYGRIDIDTPDIRLKVDKYTNMAGKTDRRNF
jgi:hypothetical protein